MTFGIVADIGGTFIRIARIEGEGHAPRDVETWMTALHADVEAALGAYLDLFQVTAPPRGFALCAAGPLTEGRIHLTNGAWTVDPEAIASRFGAPCRLVNDFAAVALALPWLDRGDLEHLGGPDRHSRAPGQRLALGPGTGLGVAGLITTEGQGAHALASEGGHVALAPASAREIAVLYQLMGRFGHVSAETILSGPGIETLHGALSALEGTSPGGALTPAEIEGRARRGDPVAVETLELFSAWLGGVAGDLALALGATQGVYLAGGVLGRLGERFDRRRFRHRFEAKGAMRPYLEAIPTFRVTAPEPALIGLASLLEPA